MLYDLSLSEEEQRTLLLVLTYAIPRLEDCRDPLNQRFHRRLVRLRERVEALDRAAPSAGRPAQEGASLA